MFRKLAILCAIILNVNLVIAQVEPDRLNSEIQGLYHVNVLEELQQTNLMQATFIPTNPPTGVIRNVAEFNRMRGVLITYRNGFGIPYSLIAEMAEDAIVYTIVTGISQENTVRSLYQNNGVNLSNCEFIYAPTDSYWTRDYGPWFITTSSGEVGIVDFPYNRPRPNDNNIPGILSNYLGISLFGMNLIHTGGNYMTDGMGISASTKLVETENPGLTNAQISQLVQDFLGVHTYHLNDDPLGQYIQHIDCWGKFLDVDKILIGEVPASHPQYTAYEAVASYYATSTSSYGTPYQVFRVYAPNGQPYTNSLILNNKVLVPIAAGTTAAQWNTPALATYQQAMPGYEVIGIAQSSQAPWQTTDALHCRTKGIADIRMLYLRHIPWSGQVSAQQQYEVRAHIHTLADSGLVADSILLVYQLNGGLWDTLLMQPDTGKDWVAYLPGQVNGTEISYYICASDSTGRKEMHPFIGRADAHHFIVLGTVGRDQEQSSSGGHLSIYPNPANDFSFLRFNTNYKGDIELLIFDLSGRTVYRERKSISTNSDHFWRIDTKAFNPGTYLVSVITAGSNLTGKLIIIK